ncbi:MAG: L-threonylcarbamoyladenylate synthase [Bacteroidetes bacterium]|nr:threonylcarbamoyl-AMP synthase [Cryomorphaceae bacterium]MBL6677472.1 threonylcarbamoyl-AMP synthase [Flavobacteriaceae bacterium]MDA0331324.1 L-threonylcarbamoyladenylate synthase [Bacteroidota bacterium]MDA0885688.1 L-threonylcarbamoyladenylate synthase [Bacteroidota bacterium]MDA1226077.1 L-threonylcarbamoyladenylate synthase [Bacteroidota bacterium]
MNNEIKNALDVLKSGGIILYPTDTIWGIGCDSYCDIAVKKIYEIKKRDFSKPLICLASSFEMVSKYVKVLNLKRLKSLSEKSPTTFIFNNPIKISKYVSSDTYSIGFRVPNDNFCLKLINKFGRPIVSTSANISGIDIPLEFNLISSEIKNKVDYIVDYGKNKKSYSASTILKIDEKGLITKLR